MASMINIDELHKEKTVKIKHKNEVYEIILKKCHQRIKMSSKSPSNPENCFFIVPPYIYGSPLYNVNSCIVYIIKCLNENGFDVSFYNPNVIFISWDGKKNPKNFKSLQKQDKKFKSIADFKPSSNFVYDNKTIDLFKKKTSSLFS